MRKRRPAPRNLILGAVFMLAAGLQAAYLVDVPQTLRQPNGILLRCFASGDEYYNWLHDAAGYTIVQDPVTGFYVYAESAPNGDIRPSALIVGNTDPAAAGLKRGLRAAASRIELLRSRALQDRALTDLSPAPKTGAMENIVIFIRFQGEAEFIEPISAYSQMFNNAAAGTSSLANYYREASYQALSIRSSFFPVPGTTVVSYQDAYPRGYYQPYQAITNPGGYSGGDSGGDRTNREHTLLKNAVNGVAAQVPAGLAVDGDGDGYVDNVVFIVAGSPTGWNSILWPHQWALYTQSASLNGKRVWTYNLQLQSAIDVGVLCHEMFHSLGAPDLYHYAGNGISPVGGWDVMEYNRNPPEHMGAFMKWRYGTWISGIPEISTAGTYTLHPLTSATGNCYKIRSPNSTTEYFVLEYRRRSGAFESSLPADGLLVYRINTARDGQGNANGPPDEVYIYRPGGTLTVNGTIDSAAFSSGAGRTMIDDWTNPWSFLSNGGPGGLNIFNIGAAGAVLSFDVSFGPSPRISLSRTALAFGAISGGPSTSSQTVVVSNAGGGTLSWTAASNRSWLTVLPEAGTGTRTASVGINPAGLAPGTYAGSVTVAAGGASNSPQTVSVTLNVIGGGGTPPFGSFDTPLDGSAVSSSIAVTGWALDDIETTGLKIYRNPVGGEATQPNGLVYIGDAVFVEGARPDVETAYPNYPLRYRAGWGYMLLTNSLPHSGNGTFTLSVFAADADAHQILLGQKTITCDNAHAVKPFGAIDTPAQGGTAGGSAFLNFGWALTPSPKFIPTDGSTIQVWIDGLSLGHPTYNQYRADIATLFPGYANSNGAVGFSILDTAGYANGTHTIAWSVTDSAGAVDGIGSRYFNVLNTGTGSLSGPREIADFRTAGIPERTPHFLPTNEVLAGRQRAVSDILSPVYSKPGYDFARSAEPAYPGPEGKILIAVSELERISLFLNSVQAGEAREELAARAPMPPSNGRYEAYLVVGSEFRPLPIGASFDSGRGVLHWQPGPGFLGDFNFIIWDREQNTKKAVTIRIRPR